HDPAYLRKLQDGGLSPSEQRRIGFPQSPALILREKIITQGTIDCSLHALQYGIGLNIAGGTHHAFADHGEGFCLLNDMAVAANYLLYEGYARKILIIDLDVHQGNGTAHLFRNETRVFTFSMHGGHNYPFHKEQSDLDIALADGTDDDDYLRILTEHLPVLIRKLQPDFAYYLCGVDVLSTDKFGKLQLSLEGCKQRDRFVLESLKDAGIPVALAMGGGYSPDIRTIVEAHCNTFRVARHLYG
ncbi:MAG TPA: histone deacetylase, partial [Sediminibacterium sp.]|nr:histone deacetylase [Sediminibacterium sp.]